MPSKELLRKLGRDVLKRVSLGDRVESTDPSYGVGATRRKRSSAGSRLTGAGRLYCELEAEKYKKYPFEQVDLGENMTLVNQVIGEYWKPRYLMDRDAKSACEFMSAGETLLTVTDEDIDWYGMKDLPQDALNVALRHSFHFPGNIYKYENGRAEVRWQLNPDGMFFIDEDGYGMTPDIEVNVFGAIGRNGRVVRKFGLKD